MINGVVHDKLYLPGLLKLKRLIDSGFFGRILSVRGEFGYWVFEGDLLPAQRPSWNYRAEDGGGIVLDMFPHWNYVLENLFGRVQAVTAKAVTHIPERWDEQGRRYDRHRRRRGLRDLRAGGRRHRPGQLVLGGSSRPRRARRVPGGRHPRLGGGRAVRLPDPAPRADADAGLEPRSARRPRTSAASGSRSRTTPSSSTGSGRSGSSSSPTWTPAARTPTISPPAYAGCSWPRPDCSPRRRVAGFRIEEFEAMTTTTERAGRACPRPAAGGGRSSSPSPAPGRNIRQGFR